MARGRGWRRWRGEVRLAQVIAYQRSRSWLSTYKPDNYDHISYTKRTSSTETVEVFVSCESHFNDYVRHTARLRRDNYTTCSCGNCCNPRNAGIGNSRQVLSMNEGIALMAAVNQCSYIDAPNSSWRSRKFGASTHAKIENYYDQRD